MRNGLPFSKPRVRLYGETGDAQQYLGSAYNLLYKVRQFCEQSGAPVFSMQHTLENGALVQAAILENEEIVSCFPPTYAVGAPVLVPLEPINEPFICFSFTLHHPVSELEAHGWTFLSLKTLRVIRKGWHVIWPFFDDGPYERRIRDWQAGTGIVASSRGHTWLLIRTASNARATALYRDGVKWVLNPDDIPGGRSASTWENSQPGFYGVREYRNKFWALEKASRDGFLSNSTSHLSVWSKSNHTVSDSGARIITNADARFGRADGGDFTGGDRLDVCPWGACSCQTWGDLTRGEFFHGNPGSGRTGTFWRPRTTGVGGHGITIRNVSGCKDFVAVHTREYDIGATVDALENETEAVRFRDWFGDAPVTLPFGDSIVFPDRYEFSLDAITITPHGLVVAQGLHQTPGYMRFLLYDLETGVAVLDRSHPVTVPFGDLSEWAAMLPRAEMYTIWPQMMQE